MPEPLQNTKRETRGTVVLGIDPGLSMTGWGVVLKLNSKLSMLEYGCIKTLPSQSATERLKIIFSSIQEIIKKHKPELMAIEELFFLKEARTVASVGQARGVILIAAARQDITHRLRFGPESPDAVYGENTSGS